MFSGQEMMRMKTFKQFLVEDMPQVGVLRQAKNLWCGPAVLSALSNAELDTDDTERLIQEIRGYYGPVIATSSGVLKRCLIAMGFTVNMLRDREDVAEKITLKEWRDRTHDERQKDSNTSYVILVKTERKDDEYHWVVVDQKRYSCGIQGTQKFCTTCSEGEHLDWLVYEIYRLTGDYQTPSQIQSYLEWKKTGLTTFGKIEKWVKKEMKKLPNNLGIELDSWGDQFGFGFNDEMEAELDRLGLLDSYEMNVVHSTSIYYDPRSTEKEEEYYPISMSLQELANVSKVHLDFISKWVSASSDQERIDLFNDTGFDPH